MNRQNGFSVVEAVLVVIAVVIIGAVGYLGYTNFLAPKDEKTVSNDSSKTESVKVENKEDLSKVSTDLDSAELNDNDLDELDKAVQDF